jgi:DNA-binding transcriptional ArsR family regulator
MHDRIEKRIELKAPTSRPMSRSRRSRALARERSHAPVFAALGDETRLSLLARLSDGHRSSISQLTEGTRLTRQGITKHLRILESAGIVHGLRAGRECLFEFVPRSIEPARDYLDEVSEQWDQALSRLKSFVETTDSN